MNERQLVVAGSLNMFVAVAAGAFGAHGLRAHVSPDMLAVWQTGVTYHLIHALGLLVIGMLMPRFGPPGLSKAGNLMFAGMVLFSGSLYILVLSGVKIVGAVTPLGGVALLASWLWIALTAWRSPQK